MLLLIDIWMKEVCRSCPRSNTSRFFSLECKNMEYMNSGFICQRSANFKLNILALKWKYSTRVWSWTFYIAALEELTVYYRFKEDVFNAFCFRLYLLKEIQLWDFWTGKFQIITFSHLINITFHLSVLSLHLCSAFHSILCCFLISAAISFLLSIVV